ncbi:MAG: serine/threonine-protein kinase [Phycisphaerae bacterium]
MDRSERIQEVLARAADAPPDQLGALLDRECGDDAAMRAEVESLLRSLSLAGRFLAAPTSHDQVPRVNELGLDERAVERPGSRIGPYKLLERIGAGGFGSVFMAEQEQPVRRKVALKIIKLGMDTGQVVARFEQERQALAMMDHSNIARVLDAGATETGRPYFVMELVKGDPIISYCDRNALSVPERLELFAQVCAAVQHAHTKGIIHRDIKPSNILVSTQDGRPQARIIDFGIAKATAAQLTDKTLFTEHRRVILGTPLC